MSNPPLPFDLDFDHTSTREHAAPGAGAPGKRTLTAQLAAKPKVNVVVRVADGGAIAGNAEAAVAQASASSGNPLPDDLRTRFEGSLGADLSAVRLHTGSESAAAAESVGARAYAMGNDIHFGAGEYAPADPFGLHLIAHEVAHTVQQSGRAPTPQYKLEVSSPGDGFEVEADRAADAMVAGQVFRLADGPAVVARSAGGHPTLHVGSSGAAVTELQEKLAAAGIACAVDGQFGPKTRAAVIAFQQSHGLGADGVVGPKTWAALDGGGGTGAAPPATGPGDSPAADKPPAVDKGGADKSGQDKAGGADSGGAQATPPEPAGGADGIRAAIVAAARSKIGTVFSDKPGPADETGDATRTGWETLTEIFQVAYPEFSPKIIKYMKYGKNNGQAGSNPNGLVSWCGIFATWAVMTGGGTAGTWKSGDRVSKMTKVTRDPKPGDVGYFVANQHHCIIASVDGNSIETIDGNSYDSDSGGNGAITSRMRSRSEFALFFKQVAD